MAHPSRLRRPWEDEIRSEEFDQSTEGDGEATSTDKTQRPTASLSSDKSPIESNSNKRRRIDGREKSDVKLLGQHSKPFHTTMDDVTTANIGTIYSSSRDMSWATAISGSSCCSPKCRGAVCSRIRQLLLSVSTELSYQERMHKLPRHGRPGTSSPTREDIVIDNEQTLERLVERMRKYNFTVGRSTLTDSRDLGRDSVDVERQEQLRGHRMGEQDIQGPHHPRRVSESSSTSCSQLPAIKAMSLPSPLSLSIPIPLNLPPPHALSPTSSAQNAHLQDLQHQLSVKTLAFQTLQTEYTSLVQKLDRQRTKCATLERKFKVSDSEIINLSNERDQLSLQVEILEDQVGKLQDARDEARKTNAASAAQYLKIMEMAGKLHGRGGSEGGRAKEKGSDGKEAIQRQGSGIPGEAHEAHETSSNVETCQKLAGDFGFDDVSNAASVREEFNRLKLRNSKLERALREAEEETRLIREACITIATHGHKVGSVIGRALEKH